MTSVCPSPLPDRAALKAEARQLRTALGDEGHRIPHARALELVARRHGYRDWNTLCALAPETSGPPRWAIGDRVHGDYLRHAFQGSLLAAACLGGGRTRLTIRFDTPVDVAASEHFSALRQRITCTVDANGQSHACLSDGKPQVTVWRRPAR